MPGCSRRILLAFFGFALALGSTSCNTNNEGKIVGIWETTGGPMLEKFKATLPKPSDPKSIVSALFVFKADGDFSFGYRVGEMYVSIMVGKYKLGTGDSVELSEVKVTQANAQAGTQSTLKVKVEIDGDTMTLTDQAGSTIYQRRVLVRTTAPTVPK